MSSNNMRPGIRCGSYPQKETALSGFELVAYRFFQYIQGGLFRILYRHVLLSVKLIVINRHCLSVMMNN